MVQNAFATRQLALLATRIPFYDILARTCAEIKIFLLLQIDLLLGLLAVKKLLRVIEAANFCHGAARCSEFFTHLSEHFCAYLGLHNADHSDLGIIGKIFSSRGS